MEQERIFLTTRSLYRGYRPFTRLAAGHMINCLIRLVWGCVRRALLQVCVHRPVYLFNGASLLFWRGSGTLLSSSLLPPFTSLFSWKGQLTMRSPLPMACHPTPVLLKWGRMRKRKRKHSGIHKYWVVAEFIYLLFTEVLSGRKTNLLAHLCSLYTVYMGAKGVASVCLLSIIEKQKQRGRFNSCQRYTPNLYVFAAHANKPRKKPAAKTCYVPL